MELVIRPTSNLLIVVTGRHIPEESEVNLSERFLIKKSNIWSGSVTDLLEWADKQKGNSVEELERLCLEKIHE